MVIVMAGDSGEERATLALAVAGRLQFELFAGDDLQPSATRKQIRAGIPLRAVDRELWVEALAALVDDLVAARVHAVVTCAPLDEVEQQLLARAGVHVIGLGVLSIESEESSLAVGGAPDRAVDALLRSLRLLPDA